MHRESEVSVSPERPMHRESKVSVSPERPMHRESKVSVSPESPMHCESEPRQTGGAHRIPQLIVPATVERRETLPSFPLK